MNHVLTCPVHRTPTELQLKRVLQRQRCMHLCHRSYILEEGDPRHEIVESFFFCFSFPGKQKMYVLNYRDFRHVIFQFHPTQGKLINRLNIFNYLPRERKNIKDKLYIYTSIDRSSYFHI
jgi:hypothetical protein